MSEAHTVGHIIAYIPSGDLESRTKAIGDWNDFVLGHGLFEGVDFTVRAYTEVNPNGH